MIGHTIKMACQLVNGGDVDVLDLFQIKNQLPIYYQLFRIGNLAKNEQTNPQQIQMTDLLQLVMDGMKWEKQKAQKWFTTPNPLLGGFTPNGYELMRGSKKLEKFIRTSLEENVRTDNYQKTIKQLTEAADQYFLKKLKKNLRSKKKNT